MTPLCRECATPHYNILHDVDYHTRAPLPQKQHISGRIGPFKFGEVEVAVQTPEKVKVLDVRLKLKKRAKKSPQRLINDYIKKMQQP